MIATLKDEIEKTIDSQVKVIDNLRQMLRIAEDHLNELRGGRQACTDLLNRIELAGSVDVECPIETE